MGTIVLTIWRDERADMGVATIQNDKTDSKSRKREIRG